MFTQGRSQRGQVLVLVALAILGLVAMVGLAVDSGAAFTEQRHSQNAADAAVLAAALAKVNNQANWQEAAEQILVQNGFSVDQITINHPPSTQDCNPNDGQQSPYVGNEEYIQVIVRSSTEPYFGQIVGVETLSTCVEAVAHARPGSNGALFNGMGIVTTKTSGDNTFLLNGSANVRVHNSGIFVNSNSSRGLFLNGGASVVMDTYGYTVSGSYGKNGGASVTPGIQQGQPLTINSETFSFIPPIPTPPTCSANGTQTTSGSTITFTPGKFGDITINGGMTAVFQPGVYCLNGNLNLNGSATFTSSGRVIFVTQDQNITFNGGTTLNIPDIEIYTRNGTWTLNGSNTFTPNRIRFYASGSGQWIVNGGSTVKANDAFFYLTKGYITWNGSSNIDLKAPPVGDPFAGLLVYMPVGNTSNIIFNGGSSIKLTGTYLAPNAPMTVNGSVSLNAIHSQIVVSSMIVNGGTTLDVTYNANENAGAPVPTSIELVQ
jgi:hypothetical protein